MILLYDGNDKEGLVNLRKKVLLGKVIKAKSFAVPENLPLTMSATKFHSFQVMTWKGNELPNPDDWAWYKKDELLYPVLTDLAPALEYLLKIIRCACKTGCSNFQCQCKKNGLPPPPPPLPSHVQMVVGYAKQQTVVMSLPTKLSMTKQLLVNLKNMFNMFLICLIRCFHLLSLYLYIYPYLPNVSLKNVVYPVCKIVNTNLPYIASPLYCISFTSYTTIPVRIFKTF